MTVMDFPASPVNGQTTTDGRYYFDSSVGSTGAWRSTPLPVGGLPAGSIMAWGTNTPPANWLLADGSAVSRSVYSSLFAVIGTQYGTGDGTTTFNLPDLRGRVPVGKNGGTFGTLGATGGAETHSHGNGSLTAGGTFFAVGGGMYFDYGTKSTDSYLETSRAYWPSNGSVGALNPEGSSSGITVVGSTSSASSLAPYQVVNYIIKASAGWTAGDSELATRLGVVEQRQILSQNYLINGGFDIWQRGTSTTLGANTPGFLADRFRCAGGGGGTVSLSRQSFSAGSGVAPGFEADYFLRYQQTAGGTRSGSSYEGPMIHQFIENFKDVQGTPVTFSFWAKAASNITVTAGYNLESVGISASAFGSFNVTTSWQRFSGTATIPTGGTGLRIFAYLPESATFTFDTWGWQLEKGSIPTSFRRNAPSIQAELAACQRYYYRTSGAGWGACGNAIGQSATTAIGFINFPVKMRAVPSTFEVSGGGIDDGSTAYFSATSTTAPYCSDTIAGLQMYFASGLVQFRAYEIRAAGSAYYGFSAEL